MLWSEIKRMRGGYVLVRGGVTAGALPLPVYGLMSAGGTEEFISSLNDLLLKTRKAGVSRGIDPFVTLSFLALPVIPKIRITDMGLFDAEKYEFIFPSSPENP